MGWQFVPRRALNRGEFAGFAVPLANGEKIFLAGQEGLHDPGIEVRAGIFDEDIVSDQSALPVWKTYVAKGSKRDSTLAMRCTAPGTIKRERL